MRTRGRGPEKKPHHHEWDIGWSSAKVNHIHLFFALVDLQDFQGLPDVFVVPSAVIFEYFRKVPRIGRERGITRCSRMSSSTGIIGTF
jgi:hypothetical protein